MDFVGFNKLINPKKIDKSMLNDPETMLVFDTNTLLDLIHQPSETVKSFVTEIERSQSYKFVPYFVAWEYAYNFGGVSANKVVTRSDEKALKETIEKNLDSLSKKIAANILPAANAEAYGDNFEDIQKKLDVDLQKAAEEMVQAAEMGRSEVQSILDRYADPSDETKQMLSSLISKYIDNDVSIDQSWIDEVEKEGKKRYVVGHGPGFSDIGKKGKRTFGNLTYEMKYGDFLIWKECLCYLKDHTDVKRFILVTKDGYAQIKTDLYRGGDPLKGPDPFLIGEVNALHSVDLIICPIFELMSTFVPGAQYRQIITTNNLSSDSSHFLTNLEEELSEKMKESDEVYQSISDYIDDNVVEKPDSMEYYWDISHDLMNLEIDDISVTIDDISSLSEFNFSSTIDGSAEIYYSTPNPAYESDEKDGEPMDIDDSVSLSFSIDLSGNYDSENQYFDDLNCTGVSFNN